MAVRSTSLGFRKQINSRLHSFLDKSKHREMAATSLPHAGSFLGGYNPLQAVIAQFLLQLALIVATSRFFGFLLKKLHQPAVMAEVIAGLVLGPTVLCRFPAFKETVFPEDSMGNLKLIADFGLMLYMFLVGVELDPIEHISAFKKAAGISLAGIAVPFACGVGVSKALYDTFMQNYDVPFTTFFVFCGVSMSITALPILARILADQNIMHTIVGEVAMSAAGSDDIIAWCLLIFVDALITSPTQKLNALYVFLIVVAFAIVLWICVRPVFTYIIEKSEHENGADEVNIATVFMVMICSAFFTQSAGVDTIFGAFLVGLVVPHDRGFAIALTEKIEDLICIVFLPLYFSFTGLVVDLGSLNTLVSWGYVVLVIGVACAGKIFGCMAAAMASNIGLRESFAIGILMNTRGLVELIVLNLGYSANVISEEVYCIFVLMALSTTLLTVPAIKWCYPEQYHSAFGVAHVHDPSSESAKRSLSLSLRRIPIHGNQDAKEEEEPFTVLTCFTNMATAQAMINLGQILTKGNVDIIGLRLKSLGARQSSVMSVFEQASQRPDPVVDSFKTLGQDSTHPVPVATAVAKHIHFSKEIAIAAVDCLASLVVFPVQVNGATYPTGWGKIVATQLFASTAIPSSVALLVDRGFSNSSGGSTLTELVKKAGPQHPLLTRRQVFFAMTLSSKSDLEILYLLSTMAHSPSVRVTILVTYQLDHQDVAFKIVSMLDYLATLSNVKIVQHQSSDKLGGDVTETLITEGKRFVQSDLIVVSHEYYTSSSTSGGGPQGYSHWLDHTCAASVMVVKSNNSDSMLASDASCSTPTIVAVGL